MAVRAFTRNLTRLNSHLTSTRSPGLNLLEPSTDVSQFSKAKLLNHGELEDGVIPEALKFSRPSHEFALSNNLKVWLEPSYSSLAHVCVAIKAGVRHENMQNNGIGHFAKKLLWRGTEKKSKGQLAGDLESVGGWISVSPGRELTEFHLTVLKENLAKGMELLAEAVLAAKFNKNIVEEQREASLAGLKVTSDNKQLTLDNSYYTAFRDHMIGQPVRGNWKSISRISTEDLKHYKDTHYTAERMTIVGTGAIELEPFGELAEKFFGRLPKSSGEVTGEEKPVFTGSSIQIRDDDVDMAHCGIFYQAPGWDNEDFYSFQLLQRIMGDYKPDRDSIVNHPHLQYNFLHKWFGEMEDFGEHESFFFAHSDIGLFGHYAATLDLGAYWVPHAILKVTKKLTGCVFEAELYRARNKCYTQLLSQGLKALSSSIAQELVYAKRRIPRSEVAKRLSLLEPRHLEKTYAKWMWDCELALAFYGPIFTQMRMYGIYIGYTNDTNQI